MCTRQRQRRSVLAPWFSGIVVILVLSPAVNAKAAGPEETTKLDCGANALFILLHLEEMPVTYDNLESVLPPRAPEGYSMLELTAAASSLGLCLEGVRFGKGDKALNRPAIVFLQDAKGGHFAVLRPVGTTGTMVQVIDPSRAPWIADYERVFAARSWTSRVLIPLAPWPVRHARHLLFALACGTLTAAGLLLWSRSSRPRRRNTLGTP